MDTGTFRWVLIVIAILVGVGVYLFGVHQARLRKRSATETYTREEVDSAIVEDEQLRVELNNLNQILTEDEVDEDLEDIRINPARDAEKSPPARPDGEIYVPTMLKSRDEGSLISYHLRHEDFRLITGEEADAAVKETGLELNTEGLLEFREQGELCFQVASLSDPGHFNEIERLDFATLGFNCFIDLDTCEHPRRSYESMLNKIDELAGLMNVKVYLPNQDLLAIGDVTRIREKLA